jgi:hypothetical protein
MPKMSHEDDASHCTGLFADVAATLWYHNFLLHDKDMDICRPKDHKRIETMVETTLLRSVTGVTGPHAATGVPAPHHLDLSIFVTFFLLRSQSDWEIIVTASPLSRPNSAQSPVPIH